MPRKRNPSYPRKACAGWESGKRQCWAREGSDYCSNHDPAEAQRRKDAGRIRHPRFAKAAVDGHTFEKAKVPTIPHIVDRAMGIAASVESGRLDPREAQAAIAALRLAWQALEATREREDRKRFAWEQEEAARRARDRSTDAPAPGEGSSENGGGDGKEPAVPPWMRPRSSEN